MKVFITWSGDQAKTIAKALREGLPNMFQTVEPWMSEEDIRAGGRWQSDLNQQLDQTNFGIIVLTPENLSAPWIHYEAGALAKKVDISAVCPYLVCISERITVTGPLTQFQSKMANETETFDLIKAINQCMEGREKLDDTRLTNAFTKLFWPPLKETIGRLPTEPTQVKRLTDDLLKEILERVRSIERLSTIANARERLSELVPALRFLSSEAARVPAAETLRKMQVPDILLKEDIQPGLTEKFLLRLEETLRNLTENQAPTKKNNGE
jgi:TIR domain